MSMGEPYGLKRRAKRQFRMAGMLAWGLAGIAAQAAKRLMNAAVRSGRRWLTFDNRDHQLRP